MFFHRETECDCAIFRIHTFKKTQLFSFSPVLTERVFLSRWRNLSGLSCSLHVWYCARWLSLLSLCLPWTGVFRLWLTSQSRRLWRSTWWRHSNANITARDATVVCFVFCFFLLTSLTLRLISAIFSVSLRLPPCLFQCCTLVYLWINKKGENA